MHFVLVLCIFVNIISSLTAIPPPECFGFYCGRPCRSDERLYYSNCKPREIEPTCSNPYPCSPETPVVYDFYQCYCKEGLFRTNEGQCVTLNRCPGRSDNRSATAAAAASATGPDSAAAAAATSATGPDSAAAAAAASATGPDSAAAAAAASAKGPHSAAAASSASSADYATAAASAAAESG